MQSQQQDVALNSCTFYLTRKKRFCKMRAISRNLCAEHSEIRTLTEAAEKRDTEEVHRIHCPLDPTHTCYYSKLEKHLKKCNAREKDQPEYYQKNINAGIRKVSYLSKVPISDIPDEELVNLIEKIHYVYQTFVPKLRMKNKIHSLLERELQSAENGPTALKHLHQQASLLSLMENYKLLNDDSCYIEFGAGRGQLTFWLNQALCDMNNCHFILIDKASHRHKLDNRLRAQQKSRFERIRIDIEHLHIGNIPSVELYKKKRIVGVSKHLCGAATDLTLRCLAETLETEKCKDLPNFCPLSVLIALCCHHRCTYSSYVGQEFLQEQGFTPNDFNLMCSMGSWATCGTKYDYAKVHEINEGNGNEIVENADKEILNSKRYQRLGLSPKKREEIGFECKRILDVGRMKYLQKHNFYTELVYYVDPTVSLENVALLAIHKDLLNVNDTFQ